MAVVYLARQPVLGRSVALKELAPFLAGDPALAQRFIREARVAGSLNHPNVVTVFDFLEQDGVPVHRDGVPGARVAAAVRRADVAARRSRACSRACWPRSRTPRR